MAPLPSGTVTFLFTDIEGSTRLWEQHPEAMRAALARHDALLREAVDASEGRVFKTIGDAFCAVFAAASPAVAAALAAQQALAAEPFGGCALRVRMAVHTGAAEAREGDFFGPSLNRVARLLAIGHGGQVLLSAATQNRLDGALPSGTSLLDLGTHRLRDLAEPERVYQLLHPDLPAAFPALNSLDSLPNNLPQQLSRFIGRQQEIQAVKTLLEKSRLTTLVGSGGVGKSRLALQVGADLLDRYPEGVWLVELAPLADPALVPRAVAQALGVREAGGRPLVQMLADYLQPRRLLLLLDNCEHLLNACASLADTLLKSCPHLRILASSREALGVAGEQSYPVPSLSLPEPGSGIEVEAVEQSEAVHLFVERARLYQPSFTLDRLNAPLVASICRRLDGIPLAIELAAAWVRSLSVAELSARLDRGFRLLTGGSRTALPRHQTLRAAIDWSYRLLNPEEQRLLQRLSVFRGGWTLEAAEAVGAGEGIEEGEVLELLTSLVDKSLVLCDPSAGVGRYRLLETVRQYAREKLVDAGAPEGVWQRHRDYYLSLAEEAAQYIYGAHQAAWQQRLEREHDNLRAALEWSLSSEDEAEAALRLVGALGQFWLMGSHLREGTDWVRKALARGRDASPLVLARALQAGWDCAFHCDVELAGLLGEEALRFAREAQDRRTIAIALFAVALMAVGRGEFEEARASAEEGMALSQAEGDRWLIGRHLAALGLIAWMRGDYAAARPFFRETLEISRELADEWHIAMTLANLAFVTRGDGDDEGARALHLEGLPLGQRLGDRRGIGWHLVGMAGVAVEQGRAERAARLLGAAAAVLEAVGSPLPPFLQREHDHTREQTAAALGEGAFATAWAEGQAMTLEQAVAYAVEDPNG